MRGRSADMREVDNYYSDRTKVETGLREVDILWQNV